MRYRIKTLDGARRKAKTEGVGFKGAFYAWESQESGDDACTYFNIGDPFTKRDLRTHFRDKQVHISGDVAIAMWEYFKVTGDDSLLLEVERKSSWNAPVFTIHTLFQERQESV